MNNKQKLELNWIGKHDPKNKMSPEPRILIETPEYSYEKHNEDVEQISFADSDKPKPQFNNMLIHGDNLLALKSLELEYTGKIKCIYIDPPYNTGAAFQHYDDNLEHSTWLSLMKPRLELLKTLLKDDGSIWISIDSYESHYLKVMCDEVFGRNNFIDEVIWQRSYAPVNLKKTLSKSHDTILAYAKNMSNDFKLNKLPRSDEANSRYKNPDNDPRGVWQSGDLSVGPVVESKVYEITTPSGRKVLPPKGYCWRLSKERFAEFLDDNRIWFGEDGNNTPRIKRFLSDVKDGVVAQTLWTYQEVGHTQDAKREVKQFNSNDVFETPKPEKLIERIITLASNPGDIVLDSFLGSGTTAAVAQKMGRKWIGIELGDHAYTHCYKRLKAVVDGEQGGISKEVDWHGGGGFKFYELAPSLIEKSKFGNPVISKKYDMEMLAQAVAKHKGYFYEPDSEVEWKQSKNGDKNFLFVTTNYITPDYLEYIHSMLKNDEHLLITTKAYHKNCENQFPNITVQQIPQSLLGDCDFMVDSYSLNVNEEPSENQKQEEADENED